jgi:hypothetical protein
MNTEATEPCCYRLLTGRLHALDVFGRQLLHDRVVLLSLLVPYPHVHDLERRHVVLSNQLGKSETLDRFATRDATFSTWRVLGSRDLIQPRQFIKRRLVASCPVKVL